MNMNGAEWKLRYPLKPLFTLQNSTIRSKTLQNTPKHPKAPKVPNAPKLDYLLQNSPKRSKHFPNAQKLSHALQKSPILYEISPKRSKGHRLCLGSISFKRFKTVIKDSKIEQITLIFCTLRAYWDNKPKPEILTGNKFFLIS